MVGQFLTTRVIKTCNTVIAQGATVAQARAALKQYKDVMQAAERFFEGKFDHIKDEDVEMPAEKKRTRPAV